MRIISGGQTGADRASLDAAIEVGAPCGGWCPAGRKAEDGIIPKRYPVTELPGAGYDARTRQNVIDSDATLIVSFGPPGGGTAFAVGCCQQARKPFLVIDADTVTIEAAVVMLVKFVREHRARALNVAGPRGSEQPAIYDYVRQVISRFLRVDSPRAAIESSSPARLSSRA